jgi:hypothetical protein
MQEEKKQKKDFKRFLRVFTKGSLLSLLFLCVFAVRCRAQGKPEIKNTFPLFVMTGKTAKFSVFGENLSPKEVGVKAPLQVKLMEAKDTDKDNKGKGSREVILEVTVPADAKPVNYEVTLTQPEGKATVQIPVVLSAEAEMDVKKPNGTFAQAMPIVGNSVAINGVFENNDGSLFRLNGKSGETWDISVTGKRAGSKADPMIRVRDNRKLSRAMAVGTSQRDARIVYKIPTDGIYYVEVMNASLDTGAEQKYRLLVQKK